ncbi:transposase [Bradyrhizobium sp. USDA 4518]
MAESFGEGANISEVARRHGVVRGLLSVWRRKFARRQRAFRRQASCRSGLLPRAVRLRQTSRTG